MLFFVLFLHFFSSIFRLINMNQYEWSFSNNQIVLVCKSVFFSCFYFHSVQQAALSIKLRLGHTLEEKNKNCSNFHLYRAKSMYHTNGLNERKLCVSLQPPSPPPSIHQLRIMYTWYRNDDDDDDGKEGKKLWFTK
jgi:hypothetical protein